MKEIQLSKEQMTQIAGGLLFSGLFIYLYVAYFWLPTSKKIAENTKKVEAISRDINNAKQQKAKFKNLEAKLASLRSEKEAAEKKLPREKKVPDLIRTLNDLSRKYGVSVRTISPRQPAPAGYFIRVEYDVNVTGTYHSLGKFLTALALLERILTMENLNISAAPTETTTINASFVLVAYQYNG